MINQATAKKIASIMMTGRPVETLDDMAQSAISELANMISANAMTIVGQNGFTM
jgi:chemotaxis protein CheX